MSENKKDPLKFEIGKPIEVVLTANEPQTGQGQYGPWNRYSIKELITGEDCFFASEGLHRQIQEGGFGMGYKMTIEKVHDAKTLKTFFKVTPHGDGSTMESATMEEMVNKVATKMDVNQTNEVKELTAEEKINILWKEREATKAKSNPADDMPF